MERDQLAFVLLSAVRRWWPAALRVAVVLSSNIVRMAFYLVLSLGATAGLFFLAGADFVGAMQLMIYVGGTLVLLIFGVMLTAQGPFISMKTRGGEWILAALVGGSLLCRAGVGRVQRRRNGERSTARATAGTASAGDRHARLGMGLLGARVDKLDEPDAAAGAACRAICCRSKSFRSICWSC